MKSLIAAITAIIASHGESFQADEGVDEAVCEAAAKEIVEKMPGGVVMLDLPLDYKLLAVRPANLSPSDSQMQVVLAYSEHKKEWATWVYRDGGCEHGEYFATRRSKDAQEKAFISFLTRKCYAGMGGDVFVLNSDEVTTINQALIDAANGRDDESKSNRDVEEDNDKAVEGLKAVYRKLNGGEEMIYG